jgi:hypothetical protein
VSYDRTTNPALESLLALLQSKMNGTNSEREAEQFHEKAGSRVRPPGTISSARLGGLTDADETVFGDRTIGWASEGY